MALTPSTMLALQTPAPDFALSATDGAIVRRSDFAGRPLLVMFICNHCPFVVHLKEALAKLSEDYADSECAIVGISANDVSTHPQDGPEAMTSMKAESGWRFPYLYDESQAVAKAYKAACTPDFFLFDRDHRLVYRGQFDSSRPGNDEPITGADLRAAMDAVIAGEPVSADQTPSIGCNIKWKPGHAPA